MTKNQNLPSPDNSGSSGNQAPSDDEDKLESSKPLEGVHISKTIEGLASSHSRSMGGEVSSTLIAGVTSQMAYEYQELKAEYKILTTKYDKQRDELEKTRITTAVLKETIRAEGKNKNLRNLSITIGTSLIGTGIILSRSQIDMYAIGAYGFGIVLLLLGWISGPKLGDEK